MKEGFSLFLGFACFGMLIGIITGLTSSPIASAIITALFGFAGGTLLLNFDSKTASQQIKIGVVLLAFSLFCTFGILAGIYTKVNRLLTQKSVQVEKSNINVADTTTTKDNTIYLRSKTADFIEIQLRRHEISKDSAIQALLNINRR